MPENSFFLLDTAKAHQLIDVLYHAYVGERGFYAHHHQIHAPQNVHAPLAPIPTQDDLFGGQFEQAMLRAKKSSGRKVSVKALTAGSLDHTRWLFFATLCDRRQVSNWVYAAHERLHFEHPELYSHRVTRMDPHDFGEMLARYRVGCPRQSAGYWIRSATTLFEDFEGDPVLPFRESGLTVEGFISFKKGYRRDGKLTDPFPGYGSKIASLYLLFLAEIGVIAMPRDAFPVDVHVQRLFFQMGALTLSGGSAVTNEQCEREIRPLICSYANEKGYCKVALSHAFWLLGRTLCTNCDKRKGKGVGHLCPVFEDCKGTAETASYFRKGTWGPIMFLGKNGIKYERDEDKQHVGR